MKFLENKAQRRIATGGAGFLLVALALFFIWNRQPASSAAYDEIAAIKSDLQIRILATGTVQPENRLEIKAPIAGRTEQVLVAEGDLVKKGQVLAWVSSTERAALIDAARSQGPEEVKRWEKLYRPTSVFAPISGMIIARNVEAGQTFTTSEAILVMSDRLTVKAQVDETDIAQIKLRMKAEIILDAYPETSIPASVDQVAYEAKTVNNVTNYVVDVLPAEAPAFMRSGMTANVTFLVDSGGPALLVPMSAIKSKGSEKFILVKEPSGKLSTKIVQTGLSDGKNIQILSGLNEGEITLIPRMNLKKPTSTGSANPLSPMGGHPPHR